jgi:hypothetical protein
MLRALTIAILLSALAWGCGGDEFRVDGLSPNLGLMRGGERITIEGGGFDPDRGVTVHFGGVRAEHVAIAGSDELWVTTPAVDRAGPVDVRVIGSDGTEFLIRGGFEFVARNEMAECVNIGKALNGETVTERKSIRER